MTARLFCRGLIPLLILALILSSDAKIKKPRESSPTKLLRRAEEHMRAGEIADAVSLAAELTNLNAVTNIWSAACAHLTSRSMKGGLDDALEDPKLIVRWSLIT